MRPLSPTVVANIKHSTIFSQININLTSFASDPITWYVMSSFQQKKKITSHDKSQKKAQAVDTKQARTRLKYGTNFEIIRQRVLNNHDYHIKNSNVKSRWFARTHAQHKQRNKNSKNQNEMIIHQNTRTMWFM